MQIKDKVEFTPNKYAVYFSIKNKCVMRIEKDKFFWKGKEIRDVHGVYERFNSWLSQVEKYKNEN